MPPHQTIPDPLCLRRIGRCWIAAGVVLLSALSPSPAAAPDDPLALQRAEFMVAYSRITARTGTAAVPDSSTLRGYVLYPYLQSARLVHSLGSAGAAVPPALDEQIGEFLRNRLTEPVAQDLRRRWLASLAARRQWERFLAFHRDGSDGASLRCHALNARIALQRTDGLGEEIARAWLLPRSTPECEQAFNWLRDKGGLDDSLVEQRVRLALAEGNAAFARQIARGLPASRAAPLLRWTALLENPRREIDALIASPQIPVEAAALIAGWTRFARADHDAAAQRLDRLVSARKLDRQAASPLALAVALPLSWDRDAAAPGYFARVEPADFDDTAREWHVRAALWARDWSLVARVIASMPEPQRRTARWRYWAARAATQLGDEAGARQLHESILTEDNYYSAMAAARLQRRVSPSLQPVRLEASQLKSIAEQLPFARARELFANRMVSEAQAEWRHGVDSLPSSQRSQAIHLAAQWRWYDQAVATATGERVFNDYMLLYPRPFDVEVATAARLAGVAPDIVYAVIRQESLYRSDAVSSADARGLMQLLPETARRTARQWNQPAPSAASLFQPAVNVALGAAHLKDLLDRFDGQLPLALAGYNAGPGAVQRWLPPSQLDSDIWIENIPYNETRNYVQRIHWHTVVFAWLRDSQAQDTTAWLRPVRP